MKIIFILLLLSSTLSLGQQKYLVSPGQEIIPIGKHDRIPDIIARKTAERVSSTSQGCGDGIYPFGYSTDLYIPNFKFDAGGDEVLGQWYVAVAGGTIDTIFWYGYENNAKDSLVFLRIHESFIGPNYGPGAGIHANAPPCQNWGYWLNSRDLHDSIAAFPDDATDTTWISTINEKGGTVAPSRPPVGYSKWGMLGIPTKHRLGLNSIAMLDAGEPCSVQVGEKIFLSFRPNRDRHWPPWYSSVSFAAWQSNGPLTTNDEDWPARDWKFYLHDSGATNCAGSSGYDVKRGWVARGPFVDDQMYTAAYNFWYSMTVTTNVPPVINPIDWGDPGITFNTIGPYVIEYEIYDCDPSEPENAAVALAEVHWSKGVIKDQDIELEEQTPITMNYTGGDLYSCEIPGQPANTIITYRVIAHDNKGMMSRGAEQSFRIYKLQQQYYLVDTGSCLTVNQTVIKGLGSTSEIPYTSFFIKDQVYYAGQERNDGTAGPYDIGGDMLIFGDVARFAWIGVNGAIALSKADTDTLDVNAERFYTDDWIFPYPQHHSRSDTINPRGMPPNFISPFWSDFILADKGTTPATYGHIFYGNGDDPCQFIVEWDSIGSYNRDSGRGETDDNLFRVILNHCDGTIEYQYTKTGSRGRDAAALVGLQADSSELSGPEPGWVFVNYFGQLYETKPRPEFCIKFYPGALVFVNAGWNLLSVANYRPDNMVKEEVYPDAVSDAFKFVGSYVQEPVLVNGRGYWLKYDKYSYAGGPGRVMDELCVNVTAGWNIIGSITKAVPTSSIVKTPPSMITSDYFKYEGGYQTVTILEPGFGYWVWVDVDGQLCLISSENMPKTATPDYSHLSQITVADRLGRMQQLYVWDESVVRAQSLYTGEMPPAAPEFDARFASTGGMIVSHPSGTEVKTDYAISVTTDAYPITVMWEALEPLTLYAGGRMVCMMEGSGAVQLKNAIGLAIGIGAGENVPEVFALGKNYPNPFNPATRFTVDIPRLTDVQLAVYNLLGQKAKTLMNGEITPGSYNMEWDGKDDQGVSVPSGIYFIRMISGSFSDIRKVVFLK